MSVTYATFFIHIRRLKGNRNQLSRFNLIFAKALPSSMTVNSIELGHGRESFLRDNKRFILPTIFIKFNVSL